MTRSEFNQVVERALALLPDDIRRALDNLAVIIEDYPSPDDLAGVGLEPEDALFGLFRGQPITERSFFERGGHLPNEIILFQRELEDCCASRRELIEEITLTLIHEVGHYLGLDEEELRALEVQARRRAGW